MSNAALHVLELMLDDYLALDRENLLIWDVVPWQGGDAKQEADQGTMHLPRLVQLLPDLRGLPC